MVNNKIVVSKKAYIMIEPYLTSISDANYYVQIADKRSRRAYPVSTMKSAVIVKSILDANTKHKWNVIKF